MEMVIIEASLACIVWNLQVQECNLHVTDRAEDIVGTTCYLPPWELLGKEMWENFLHAKTRWSWFITHKLEIFEIYTDFRNSSL